MAGGNSPALGYIQKCLAEHTKEGVIVALEVSDALELVAPSDTHQALHIQTLKMLAFDLRKCLPAKLLFGGGPETIPVVNNASATVANAEGEQIMLPFLKWLGMYRVRKWYAVLSRRAVLRGGSCLFG